MTEYNMNAYKMIVAFCLVIGSLGCLPAASVAEAKGEIDLCEKIYLHIDKAFYMPGEIVWFKAYVVDASTGKPIDVSRVVYVEVVDPRGEPALQAKVPVGASETNSGSLYIPPDISTGRYRLVAYTALMESEGPESFFTAYIDIVNPLQETAFAASADLPDVLQFFPESGQMLDGVGTHMGFKLLDGRGNGRAFEATVFEQDTIEVARIRGNRFGMGRFPFTPRKGVAYTVRLTSGTASDANLQVTFPAIVDDGYLFNMQRSSGNAFQVCFLGTSQHVNKSLTLLARSHAGFRQRWTIRLDAQGQTALQVGLEELPAGVVCFTLFDPDGRPVAERLVFKPGDLQVPLRMTVGQPVVSHREQVNISVQVPEVLLADSLDASAAVFKVDALQRVPNAQLGAYLHLQAEVKGHIEDIAYYFSSDADVVQDDLDLLLLTQAWRKINPPDTPKIPEYKSHLVSIRFSEQRSGQPIRNEMAFLSVPSTNGATYTAVTDSNGVAAFSVRKIYGTKQIIARLASSPSGAYDAEVLSPYADRHENLAVSGVLPDEYLSSDLHARSIEAQATHVYHRRERGRYQPVDEFLLPFYGRGDVTYRLDDYTRFVLMEEVLREYVTEVSVRRNRDEYGLRVLDADNNVYFQGDPLILLDGIPLVHANEIMGYDPLKVEKIDVVTGKYYYGTGVYDGIVSLSTYGHRLDGFELDEQMKVFTYDGLQYEREFYVPPYGDGMESNARLPDFRNVLLWTPRLVFDETGVASLQVVTSDLSGRFAVVVQGVDKEGRTVYHVDYFDVN